MTNNAPVRVLYYIAYYQRMAGANRAMFDLVTHLPNQVAPLVLFAGEGRAPQAYREAGIEVEVMPPGPSLSQFGKVMLNWSLGHQLFVGITELLPYTFQLLNFIREFKPDIIHIDSPRSAILIGLAAKLAGCPVVGHMHGSLMFGGVSQAFFETISDRIITVCSAIQSYLSSHARSRAITIYNGIKKLAIQGTTVPDLAAYKAQGKLIVCCFASVVPFKGHHHLMETVAELNRRGWCDQTVFVCVGDFTPEYRSYQDWLFQRQQELGINNLIFTGWQSDPLPYYRSADIEVLPSVSEEQLECDDRTIEVRGNEAFPISHLEAMAFSLPIVGTAIAGIPEQIENGVNGFIVRPGDSIALANALEQLLADSTLRRRMGQAGYERIRDNFSIDTCVDGVMNVYSTLVPRLATQQLAPKQALSV
jgi:glycosyltransferase involved in cell wall biosynthesis